jgi:uncharacterized Zn finger protein
MRRNEGFPYGRTIKVDGGLKAQSTRGAIGSTWWSKRFLSVLESLAMDGRLARGRSYARAGQVLSLTVTPGKVTASVQGSRPKPYNVRIGLKVFPDAIWQQVEQALAEQALFSARLLAGEMPQEIEGIFAHVSMPLFPTRSADLAMECSCPDWGVPCKHLAATFYLLAEAFDADPFQIMQWRGRDRKTLLANLRHRRGAESGKPARRARSQQTVLIEDKAPIIGSALALGGLPSPDLAGVVDRFWVAPVPLGAQPPMLDTDVDLLLRQLATPAAAAGGPALIAHLREYYRALAPPPDAGRGAW